MESRYCELGENQTQEHFESCDFTKEMRLSLDLKQETDQLVLWRKLTRASKYVVQPVTREQTRQGDPEGITTHAVVAISAQDISVGKVIGYCPP